MKKLIVLLMALLLMLTPVLAEQAAVTPAEYGLTAPGYVYITAGAQAAWYPLTDEDEEPYEVTINLTDAEGHLYENVVCITHEGAYMLRSNCDNQDCVGEGIVTLHNKELRILGNWIVCLPHQVSIELYSAQEVLDLLVAQLYAAE